MSRRNFFGTTWNKNRKQTLIKTQQEVPHVLFCCLNLRLEEAGFSPAHSRWSLASSCFSSMRMLRNVNAKVMMFKCSIYGAAQKMCDMRYSSNVTANVSFKFLLKVALLTDDYWTNFEQKRTCSKCSQIPDILFVLGRSSSPSSIHVPDLSWPCSQELR